MRKLIIIISLLLLSSLSLNSSELNFIWTATGDDGHVGTAAEYDFRQFSSPIVDWELGYRLLTQAPKPSGSAETLFVATDDNVYWWAIKVIDDAGNISEISNVTITGISPITVGGWND